MKKTKKEPRHTCVKCKKKREEKHMTTYSRGLFPILSGRGYRWQCKECKPFKKT